MKKLQLLIALAVFLFVASPTFAARTVRVSRNGAGSINRVEMVSLNSQTVMQANQANIANVVLVDSNTGDNTANANTGGGVTERSGNSNTSLSVLNDVNSNDAIVVGCGCEEDADIVVRKNGVRSRNTVVSRDVDEQLLLQENQSNILNVLAARSNTGGNEANRNTDGTISTTSGSSTTTAGVSTFANYNWARVR